MRNKHNDPRKGEVKQYSRQNKMPGELMTIRLMQLACNCCVTAVVAIQTPFAPASKADDGDDEYQPNFDFDELNDLPDAPHEREHHAEQKHKSGDDSEEAKKSDDDSEEAESDDDYEEKPKKANRSTRNSRKGL